MSASQLCHSEPKAKNLAENETLRCAQGDRSIAVMMLSRMQIGTKCDTFYCLSLPHGVQATGIVYHHPAGLCVRGAQRLKPGDNVVVHVRVAPPTIVLIAGLHCHLRTQQQSVRISCLQ